VCVCVPLRALYFSWCVIVTGPFESDGMDTTTPPLGKGGGLPVRDLTHIHCDLMAHALAFPSLAADQDLIRQILEGDGADLVCGLRGEQEDQDTIEPMLLGGDQYDPADDYNTEDSEREKNQEDPVPDDEGSERGGGGGESEHSDFEWEEPGQDLRPDVEAEDINIVQEHEVRTCHCQAPPNAMPAHYTPPCLPWGVSLAKREIQMFPEFRDNLLGIRGAPQKTQTLRIWGTQRSATHYTSYMQGKWIRVWRGQGHMSTIGWMLITNWDEILVRCISPSDCAREGRPRWLPSEFVQAYFPELTPNTTLTRVQFLFRPCQTVLQ
jgi:hypothetical protein